MIERIILENFQSHAHTDIKFESNFHTIIGTSDSGKSAILRGLRWVITNKPSGDEFISHWGGDCKVTVYIDGKVISREKGKGLNRYMLGKEEFLAFGTEVPDEIADIFNMNNINIGMQFDGYFLLDETPGKISQYFNKIIGISEIDTSNKNIGSFKSEIKSQIKVYKSDLKDAKQKIKTQKDYTDFKQRLGNHLELVREIKIAKADFVGCEDIYAGIKTAKHKIRSGESLSTISDYLELAISADTDVEFNRNKLAVMERLCHNIEMCKRKINVDVSYDVLEKLITVSTNIDKKINRAKKEYREVDMLLDDIETSESKLHNMQNALDADMLLLEEEFEKGCPLCGK